MKKILVIDYDQSSLQNLHKTLTQEGFEVVLASDGQTGWEKFQAEKPDLVLMEAMLSKIHGFELCDRITKDPVRKVPVFIMTGVYKDRVYRTEALRTYGASEYFEKPLDMLKFVASIHALLTVPDIKPDPGAKPVAQTKPGNGEPPDGPQPMPVMPLPKEEKRRGEPAPAPKPPKAEAPRSRPSSGPRSGGDMGLSLETVLKIHPAREEQVRPEFLPDFGPDPGAPPKHSPDTNSSIEDDLRLEALLNIKPEKEEPRRPEPAETIDPLSFLSKDLEEKPREHARKDHAAEDIDKLLKTTLADFGLETDKKKPAKAAPPPFAPAPVPEKPRAAAPLPQRPKPAPAPVHPPAPPVPEKPKPAASTVAPAPAVEKPKPVPPPPVPEKPKPAASTVAPAPAVEKPKPVPPPPMPAAVAEKPKPVPAPPAPAPKAEPKAAPKEPARAHEPQKQAEPRMFKDIYAVEKKKSPVPFIAVGAGLVVVAAVGYFILRPKHTANPDGAGLPPAVTQSQSSLPEKAPETSVPSLSEEKLKAVKAKPQVVQKPAEPLPTAADAIVPPQITDVSRLTARTQAEKKPDAKPSAGTPAGAAASDAKVEEAKTADTKAAENQATQSQEPPVNVGAAPPQGGAGTGGDASSQPAPAAKASPGDLVDLAAVDDQPKILKSVEPVYPAQARRSGKEGSVTVNALVNEAGNVTDTGILKGLKNDMGLEKAAADAVRKWKFQPAKKDGVNVKVWKPIVITFKANRTGNP